ncbi:DUF3267 domain-containing protein [Clostridium cavendishii]|nr:DUF3267 domain-containing protein [Clostridium cavendishii]
MSFIITKKIHIIALIIACVITILWIDSIMEFNNNITNQYGESKYYLIIVLATIINTIVHELLHGLAYSIFGGKFKIGFKGIYAYTQETTGRKFSVTQFAIILLAPVMIISIFSLLMPLTGGLVFFINLIGSTGDLIMAFWLIRVKKSSLIIDTDKGFDVIEDNIIFDKR